MAGPPSRGSFPSVPGEPRVRRLGVGSGSRSERPLRAQIVVALVCTAMLIAVPLYLLRKPSTHASASVAASAGASASASPLALPAPSGAAPAAAAAAAAVAEPRLQLGAVQRVRCGASANATQSEGTLCDALPPFEEALKQAISTNDDCGPKSKLKGSINYVLTVDFAKKKLHVFPGASGDWHGKQARRSTSCIERAVKVSDWNVPHQYRFYAIAILATYPGTAPPGAPASPGAAPAGSAAPGAPKPLAPGQNLPNFE